MNYLFVGTSEMILFILVVIIIGVSLYYFKDQIKSIGIEDGSFSDEINLLKLANGIHLWGIISSVLMVIAGLFAAFNGNLFMGFAIILGGAFNYLIWLIVKSFIKVFVNLSLRLAEISKKIDGIVPNDSRNIASNQSQAGQ